MDAGKSMKIEVEFEKKLDSKNLHHFYWYIL